MVEPSSHFWDIFFRVYESLPRQGPGNRDCAARALGLCGGLPSQPRVLDLGCGVGGQTIHLAELTTGDIVALDLRQPCLERLQETTRALGLDERISSVVGDMRRPCLAGGVFDLVWSEGALYSIGLENSLQLCREVLRPGGCLAFTDAVWREQDPPAEVRELFEADYPTMGRAEDVVRLVETSGFSLLGRFTLPDEAWLDDFYTPMRRRLGELRAEYSHDGEALAILDEISREPELFRAHSRYFSYDFFIARR